MSKELLKIGIDLGTEKDEQCAVINLHYNGIDHIIYETCDKEQVEALNKIMEAENKKISGSQYHNIMIDEFEPKNYLKWEDLEFSEERQEIPVRMGETIYILVLRKTNCGTKLAKLLSPKRNYMGEWGEMFTEEAKQFFNDLHLEVIEGD